MDDLRIILNRALPDSPPSPGITREVAIAAGRRERRRQRWLRALGAFLSTAVVAGGVTWGLALRPVSNSVDLGGPSQSPSPTTSATVPQSAAPTPSRTSPVAANPTLRADLDLAALSAILSAAAAKAAPGATMHQVANSRPGSPPGPFELIRSQGGVKAWADVKDAQGVGTVFINLNPSPYAANMTFFQTACASAAPERTCETRTGADGELITIQKGPLATTTTLLWTVTVAKRNGTAAYVEARNYSQNDQPASTRSPTPQRDTPPLTTDQLIEILLTPGLDVT